MTAGFWLLFFVALPLAKGLHNVAEIALLLLGLWQSGLSPFRQALVRYRHVAALALVLAALLTGLLYTQNLIFGFKLIRHHHRLVVMPLIFLLHAPHLRQHFYRYLGAFIVGVSIGCLVTVVLFWLPEESVRQLTLSVPKWLMLPYPEVKYRTAFGLYSPFIDRIQFSSLIGLALLSTLYLAWQRQLRVTLLLLPLLAYTMLSLGGRGGQLALLGGLLVFLVGFGYRVLVPRLAKHMPRKAAGPLVIMAALALTVALPLLAYQLSGPVRSRFDQGRWEWQQFESGQYSAEEFKHFTTIRRIISVQNMWKVVKQHPVMGVGTGDFEDALAEEYRHDGYEVIENVHNQYLYIWGAIGLWGLLLFLGVLGYWAWRMRGQVKLSVFAWSVLAFYLVNMLPDAVLLMQADAAAFTAFLCLVGVQNERLKIEDCRLTLSQLFESDQREIKHLCI